MVIDLQFFGGRGTSFGKSTSAIESFRSANTKVFDSELTGMNMKLVEKNVGGSERYFKRIWAAIICRGINRSFYE